MRYRGRESRRAAPSDLLRPPGGVTPADDRPASEPPADQTAGATSAGARLAPNEDPFAEEVPLTSPPTPQPPQAPRPPRPLDDVPPPRPGPAEAPAVVDAATFEASFGEPIYRTLDLDTWAAGVDVGAALDRLEAEVARALDVEDTLCAQTREILLPRLEKNGGGVFQVTRAQLEVAQRTVLLNGAVEAADGVCTIHDTLPLTVAQIGVCLTGYAGEQGAWGHRLFRRDVRVDAGDPIEEALAILERRDLRADLDGQGRRDLLSHLFRRGILAWAQRAVLLRRSDKPWRMGHGLPAPHELLTGSGNMELLHASLRVLRGLLLEHRRFLFVPSQPSERLLLTIGNALGPAQFAVVETAERRMEALIQEGHLIGRHFRAAREFFEDAAPNILAGVYRTYAQTPPQVFYAHKDFVQEAAVIAMADSLLQSHRTFPALLDLAESVCESLFGAEGFNSSVQGAYARRGHPLRYVSEKQTKR